MPPPLRRLLVLLIGLALLAAWAPALAQGDGEKPPDEPVPVASATPEPAVVPKAQAPTPFAQDDEEEESVQTPSNLEIVAMPVFGNASLPPGGWGEVIVRITNKGGEPAKGQVKVFGGLHRGTKEGGNFTLTPYAAAAGSTVSLRIPMRVSERDNPLVRVYDANTKIVFEQGFQPAGDNRTLLVNVAKASVLGAALRGVPAGSGNDPWGWDTYSGVRSPPNVSTIEVTSPLYDTVTGDALLPRRAAGYARVATVIMRSEELVNFAPLELEALSGFVLAGGTLGVIITRPEDLRNALVMALIGGEASAMAVQPETLAELVLRALPITTTPSTVGAKPAPIAAAPEAEMKSTLRGFEGGNLRHTTYGASAAYGLGEVHLLAFDPQTKPGVDSAWVHVRMVDMLRRANERTSSVLFRHGDRHTVATDVRRQLDPNESSRWAIVVAALLLCLYSVLAGPVNFGLWRRRHRPLRALIWLPIASAIAFGSVVAIGISAKGCSGRARHLTFVEVGAGMKRGTARKWRGFFVPTAREMTVRTGNASSVLGVELMELGDDVNDTLRIDRDGLRLQKLALRPWETLVVREDGYAGLGGGISLLYVGEKELKVKNKTGRRLRGLVLSTPWGDVRYLSKLDDNASVSSKKFRSTSRVSAASSTAGSLPMRRFEMFSIEPRLEDASPGLTNAWAAVSASVAAQKNWFPADVPVLLAQLEGGEGAKRDTGLELDSDRVLVRVVGYGGI